MLLKATATCFLALVLLNDLCVAQKFLGGQDHKRPFDPQQFTQTFEPELKWVFPGPPEPESVNTPDNFEIRHPVSVPSVAVECRENSFHVEVKKDMFGIGHEIYRNGLFLGDCAVSDDIAQVFIFEEELQNCGAVKTMTDDAIIYTYTLNYSPQQYPGSPVVRTSQAAVIVECHYQRRHNVSSLAIEPIWVPFSAVKVAEEFLYFSLKLMTDEWQYVRPSHQYYLGDVLNFEASVKQYFHVPLRVYVDSCVATTSPDPNSTPRYTFIDNHGCFIDARITPSSSTFLARQVDHILRFQLDAFRFENVESGQIYITCHLRATTAAHNIHEEHRACSFTGNMWREANGVDAACGTCESGSFGSIGGGSGGSGGTGGGYGGGQGSGGGQGTGGGYGYGGGQGGQGTGSGQGGYTGGKGSGSGGQGGQGGATGYSGGTGGGGYGGHGAGQGGQGGGKGGYGQGTSSGTSSSQGGQSDHAWGTGGNQNSGKGAGPGQGQGQGQRWGTQGSTSSSSSSSSSTSWQSSRQNSGQGSYQGGTQSGGQGSYQGGTQSGGQGSYQGGTQSGGQGSSQGGTQSGSSSGGQGSWTGGTQSGGSSGGQGSWTGGTQSGSSSGGQGSWTGGTQSGGSSGGQTGGQGGKKGSGTAGGSQWAESTSTSSRWTTSWHSGGGQTGSEPAGGQGGSSGTGGGKWIYVPGSGSSVPGQGGDGSGGDGGKWVKVQTGETSSGQGTTVWGTNTGGSTGSSTGFVVYNTNNNHKILRHGGGSSSSSGSRKIRDVSKETAAVYWEGDVSLGPFTVLPRLRPQEEEA